jgi:hypothetical protein
MAEPLLSNIPAVIKHVGKRINFPSKNSRFPSGTWHVQSQSARLKIHAEPGARLMVNPQGLAGKGKYNIPK